MEYPIEAHRKLMPEMSKTLQGRFKILNYIKVSGPIGRRLLGEVSGLSERETRTMIDFLRGQQLIKVARNGVTISGEGLEVLNALEPIMPKWSGLTYLEQELQSHLGIQAVKIVEEIVMKIQ